MAYCKSSAEAKAEAKAETWGINRLEPRKKEKSGVEENTPAKRADVEDADDKLFVHGSNT